MMDSAQRDIGHILLKFLYKHFFPHLVELRAVDRLALRIRTGRLHIQSVEVTTALINGRNDPEWLRTLALAVEEGIYSDSGMSKVQHWLMTKWDAAELFYLTPEGLAKLCSAQLGVPVNAATMEKTRMRLHLPAFRRCKQTVKVRAGQVALTSRTKFNHH